MKETLRKYPVIAFSIFSIILLPLIGGLNLMLFPSSFNYALMFPQWAPALAALFVVGVISGKSGITTLFQKTSISRSSLKWSLIAAVIPIICCSLSYMILMFVEYGQWISPTFTRSFGNYILCFVATLFGCYGEEIGWRGFMLPKLNQKYSLFTSSLIIGLVWGIWHMRFQIGMIAFGLFIVGVICYSFLITWLCSKTKDNIFVAIVFHLAINMCSLLLFENVLSDITEQQTEASISNPHLYIMLYGIYAIIFAVPCLIIGKNIIGKETIGNIK